MKRLKESFHKHKKTFTRSQITSAFATLVDFVTLYCLVEYLNIYYVVATAIGAVFGAVANFLTNRYWAFEGHTRKIHHQGFNYAIVSIASLLLNVGIVYLLTDYIGLKYLYSKVISSILVGWLWNYPMHRYFVFR